MGLCTGACLLGHVRRRNLWSLAQVLSYVSAIQVNLLSNIRVRGNQLVLSVNKINRFYMQCKIMSYNMINDFFPSR